MSRPLIRKPKKRPPIPRYAERRRLAKKQRLLRVKWLRKKGKTAEAKALAKLLERCTPAEPCNSGSCSSCLVVAQERLVRALKRLIARTPEHLTIFVLTVATDRAATPVVKLSEFDLGNAHRRLRRALNEGGVAWAVAGLDVSFNEHQGGQYQPFVMPHHLVIGATGNFPKLSRLLRKRWRRTTRVLRPVKMQRWDGQPNALYYLFKASFKRRVGYNDHLRQNKKSSHVEPCRDTRKQNLRSAELLELTMWLSEVPILKRLTMSKLTVEIEGKQLYFVTADGSHRIE